MVVQRVPEEFIETEQIQFTPKNASIENICTELLLFRNDAGGKSKFQIELSFFNHFILIGTEYTDEARAIEKFKSLVEGLKNGSKKLLLQTEPSEDKQSAVDVIRIINC